MRESQSSLLEQVDIFNCMEYNDCANIQFPKEKKKKGVNATQNMKITNGVEFNHQGQG